MTRLVKHKFDTRRTDRAKPGGKNGPISQPGILLPAAQKPTVFPDPDPLVFTREDWTEFRDADRISAKAGVSVENLPRLVVKELADNALDAAGAVEFAILPAAVDEFRFFVADPGAGVPGTDEELSVHFSMRRPLTSSKTRRMPTRGMLGNGLRVVVGVVYVGDGELRLCTCGRALILKPQSDGTTVVLRSESWAGTGTRIEVTLRKEMGSYAAKAKDLFQYAQTARELTAGSTYNGRPSPWWYSESSFWELLQAAGDKPVERVVADLDGCSSRAKVTKVVDEQKGKACREVSEAAAATILEAARHEARPVSRTRLGKVGRRDDFAGYASDGGEFRRNGATVPFVVEAWANRSNKPAITLGVNRTPVVTSPSVWRHSGGSEYVLKGCGFECDTFPVGQKRGGEFRILVNIIAPFVPLTSSGKDPDTSPMSEEILNAIEAAVKRAKRATPRGGSAMPQKEIVITGLDAAVEELSGNGQHLFSLRQLFYRLRPRLIAAIGREPNYGTFSKIIGEYEDEHGDIEQLYRDDRGTLYHPHTGESIRLGTRSMSKYQRPKWAFNKILYCEKEGLFPILQHARWPELHDCALLTSKGYATRAAREALRLIQQADEPVQFFCVHDADGDGTMIYETLRRSLASQKVNVINLGLDPAEARRMQLEVEPVDRQGRVRVAAYVPASDQQWLQKNRIELNAMTTPQFVDWLTAKITAHDTGKVIPPDDVIREQFLGETRTAIERRFTEELLREARLGDRVNAAMETAFEQLEETAASITRQLRELLKVNPVNHWSGIVEAEAQRVAKSFSWHP